MIPLADPGHRARLARNLDAHRHSWGVVPTWTDQDLTEVRFSARIEPRGSASERWSAALSTGEHWRLLHSDRDPAREAASLIDRALEGHHEPGAVVLVGVGLGYAVEAVYAKNPDARILVLEPLAGLIPALLARRDWTSPILERQLCILSGPGYAGQEQAWRILAGRLDSQIVVAPQWILLRPEASLGATRVAAAIRRNAVFNDEATRRFGSLYRANVLANLPRLLEGGDVADLTDGATGRPAVVAAAGPSLDRNLEELRPLRAHVTLVAVDTALRPLLQGGLEPDFVVAVDPSPANARMIVEAGTTTRTEFVTELSVDPRAFDQFPGRAWLFRVGDNDPWPWLRSHGLDLGVLHAWGSVLITAVDFALRLGARPVVVIGADLSYPEQRPYCRGTVYEPDWARAVADGQSLEGIWKPWLDRATRVEEGIKCAVPTTDEMVAFRDALLALARHWPPGTLLNATGDGILHGEGLPTCRLAELPLARSTAEVAQPLPRKVGFAAAEVLTVTERLLSHELCVPPPTRPDDRLVQALGHALRQLSESTEGPLEPAHLLAFVLEASRTSSFRETAAPRLLEAVIALGARRSTLSQPWSLGPLLDDVMRYARALGQAGRPAAEVADRLLADGARRWARRLNTPTGCGGGDAVRVALLGTARRFSPRDVPSWALSSLAGGLARLRDPRLEVFYVDLGNADADYLEAFSRDGATVRNPLAGIPEAAHLAAVRAQLSRDYIDVTVNLGVHWLTAATNASRACRLQVGFDYGRPRYGSGWDATTSLVGGTSSNEAARTSWLALDPRQLSLWWAQRVSAPARRVHHLFGCVGSFSDWPLSFMEFAARMVAAHPGSSMLACGLGDPSALERTFDAAGLRQRLEVDAGGAIEDALCGFKIALEPAGAMSLFPLLLKSLNTPVLRWVASDRDVPPLPRLTDERRVVALADHDPVAVATLARDWLLARLQGSG